ncbi:MAG: TIGR01777 family oxidoreductase [Acidobacteria bacterium]|nr:TIGR01777 family oxidoreductase [Acidobacteriota bacterium]
MKILISGASGFIGSYLTGELHRDRHTVVKLVRDDRATPKDVAWNIESYKIVSGAMEGFDVIIHLAGENLSNGRWTKSKKKKIYESRIIGTKLLAETIDKLKNPPSLFISASAVGYYGDRGNDELTEKDKPGEGFLTEVCRDWESASELESSKTRVVNIRTGVVIGNGGMLNKLLPVFKMGLGARLGTGKQYMSWINIKDFTEALKFIIRKKEIKGPFNLVSPEPVTNSVFTKELGRLLGRPAFLFIPGWVLKIIFGELADEMLLSSTKVQPEVLLKHGFKFKFPSIRESLMNWI